MDSGSFNGIAVFLVLAVITGVITYLAVQQSKIKRQIEESRRQREQEELAVLGSYTHGEEPAVPKVSPGTTPLPKLTPREASPAPDTIPDITPASLPRITPGGTPHIPPSHPGYIPPSEEGDATGS